MEGKECHCVFSGDAPLLACLLFCSQLRPFLDPPLLTERCRPTTWHGQWLQTNSNRRMQITVAGCTTWTGKNKARRRQKKSFRQDRARSTEKWELTDTR